MQASRASNEKGRLHGMCSLPFIFLRKERTGNEGTRTDRQNQGAPPSPPLHGQATPQLPDCPHKRTTTPSEIICSNTFSSVSWFGHNGTLFFQTHQFFICLFTDSWWFREWLLCFWPIFCVIATLPIMMYAWINHQENPFSHQSQAPTSWRFAWSPHQRGGERKKRG